MKLQAEIGDERHEVEIKRDGEKVFAEIDGRLYEVEASEPEPGVFLIKHENNIYDVPVSANADGTKTATVRGRDFSIRLIDPKRLRGTAGTDSLADGIAEIKTAMPGKVVRILLEIGAVVEKGDGVIVVEAMKMQNELKSPKAGVIKDIRVSEASTVSAGDVLITIE
mgnify:CR=1 FL=1